MGSDGSSIDLFDLIGQENRMAILRALVDADASSAGPYLSFSELKRQAGIEDTGQFNYHLGELVGTLVVKDGTRYRLSGLARRILRPMATGYYDPEVSVPALGIPGSCPRCDGALFVRLRENVLRVVCETEHVLNYGLVASPGLVAEHSADTAVSALGLLTTHAVEQATHGICPKCHSPIEGRIRHVDSIGIGSDLEPLGSRNCHLFRAPCDACGNRFMVPVGGCVVTHPTVVELYAAHDIDVRSRVPWTLPFRQAGAEDLLSQEPVRVGLEIGEELAGESLYVTMDRKGAVQALYHTNR